MNGRTCKLCKKTYLMMFEPRAMGRKIWLNIIRNCILILYQFKGLKGKFLLIPEGAPIAHLGERRTPDHKVVGSILTQAALLCP